MGIPFETLPHHVQVRIKESNPDVFKSVGGLQARQPEPTSAPTLAGRASKLKKGKGGVVAILTLLAYRSRLLDDDNNIASFKALRDSIARWLNTDDADPRIKWQYGQIETKGSEGASVTIEIV